MLTTCIVGNAVAKKEITYMIWANTAGEAASIRKDLDMFEEAFPEIKVKLVYVPSPDHLTKLLTMIAGKVAPDVFVVFGAFLNSMYNRGVFEPLDRFIENDPESGWGDFFVQDACVFDGKIMVLPHFAGGFTLAYNEELFEQAGLSMPYDIWKEKAWNWQTFIEMAKKLTKDIDGDGLPDQYGANPNLANAISFFIALRGFGEQPFNPSGTRCLLDSSQAKEALQLLVDLVRKHKVMPPPELEAAKLGIGFKTEKVAMQPECPGCLWINTLIEDMSYPFKWNIVPYPAGPAGFGSWVNMNPIAISNQTKDKASAYELIKFLTGTKVCYAGAEEGRWVPTGRRSVIESPEMAKLLDPRHMDIYLEAANGEIAIYPAKGAMRATGIINNELGLALQGKKSAEQACEDMTLQINEVIQ